MSENKLYVTWSEVEEFVKYIGENYKGTINGVYGLPRGGLVIATMVSYLLNIPLLSAPCEGCLVVDDICDTGESLIHYAKNTANGGNSKYNILTMFYKPHSSIKVNYQKLIDSKIWVVFPWEKTIEEYEQ